MRAAATRLVAMVHHVLMLRHLIHHHLHHSHALLHHPHTSTHIPWSWFGRRFLVVAPHHPTAVHHPHARALRLHHRPHSFLHGRHVLRHQFLTLGRIGRGMDFSHLLLHLLHRSLHVLHAATHHLAA